MRREEVFRPVYQRAETNFRALELLSRFLNESPRSISGGQVEALSAAAGIPQEEAYRALVAAACGLDGEAHPEDRELETKYFAGAIHCMDDSACSEDPYYRQIKMPEIKRGSWEMGYKTLAPYECFPSDDILCLPGGLEIPQAGYFTKAFRAPVVKQHGREWMTVTPSERNTMLPHIAQACGNVAVFGLGLGYFPFMISGKAEVHAITVVERDEEVISLFREWILPQFPKPERIEIVQSDAFDFAAQMKGYDTAYVDLWHDVGDGAEMYLRMKAIEKQQPQTRFLYWIEPSILAFIRSLLLYDHEHGAGVPDWMEEAQTPEELQNSVSNENLRRHAARLPLSLVRPE